MPEKRAKNFILRLVASVLALGVVAIVLAVTIDLRPLIERFAAGTLHRQLSLGAFRIGWGVPLSVEIRDLHLANAGWGSEPDMFSLARLTTDIEISPLLRGIVRCKKLRIEGPTLLLERDSAGVPNWHFSGGEAPPKGLFGNVPNGRAHFPTLIHLWADNGKIVYREPGTKDLRLDIDDLTIRSAGDDQAVTLELGGAYNDTSVHLNGTTDSFSALRDAAHPFGTDLSILTESATLALKGTMTEPLDFDGVQGELHIDAQKLGAFLKSLGAEIGAEFPLVLDGTFARKNGRWELSGAAGRLAGNEFDGTLALTESGRHRPDELAISLEFPQLDLKELVESTSRSGSSTAHGSDSVSLHLADAPTIATDARVDAKQVTYGATRLANFTAQGRTGPGLASLSKVSFNYGGGRVEASGDMQSVATGSRVSAKMAMSEIDVVALARLLGAPTGQIAGRLDGHVALEMTGETLNGALGSSKGQAVLGMTQGRVSRALLETVSTDLRSFFRTSEGAIEMSCLLGVAILERGVATISPLRMRTPDATLVGGGRADLPRQYLDMTIKTLGASTSVFALDVPIRLSGGFDTLHAVPAVDPPALLDRAASDNRVSRLAPELRQIAKSNPCFR